MNWSLSVASICIFTVLQQCSMRWLSFVFQSAGQWPGTQWKRTFWLLSVVIAKPLGTRPAVLCFFTNRTDATGMATWEARESGRKKGEEKVPCFKVHLRLRILAHNTGPATSNYLITWRIKEQYNIMFNSAQQTATWRAAESEQNTIWSIRLFITSLL